MRRKEGQTNFTMRFPDEMIARMRRVTKLALAAFVREAVERALQREEKSRRCKRET